MNGIYSLIDAKIHINPEAVQFLPMLSQLSEAEIKYVVSVNDLIDSPLRAQPVSQRREQAVALFFPNEEDKKKKIELLEGDQDIKDAIEEVKAITYDPDRATYDVLLDKLNRLHQELPNIPIDKVEIYLKTQERLQERMDKLKIKIEKEQVNQIEIRIRGDKRLSYLEIWQRSRDKFHMSHGWQNT